MNIHPILVHFPIAFLVTYSLLELLRFKKLNQNPHLFYIKALLVILGVVSAFAAVVTGNLAEEEFTDKKNLIELHSHINQFASAVFASAAFAYVISLLKRTSFNFSKLGSLWKLALLYENFILKTPVTILIVLVGLILISLGGALGGAISYGQDFDPFTKLVYSIFFH